MPRLVINGTAHELIGDLITIGRAPGNTIVIEDSSVSSRHAELLRDGENYRLKDLDSTNGTRVNGASVTETTLRPGDRIQFGAAQAHYETAAAESQVQPQPPRSIESESTKTSAATPQFGDSLLFQRQKDQKDPVRTAILIASAVVLLLFFCSMVAVLLMHAPPA